MSEALEDLTTQRGVERDIFQAALLRLFEAMSDEVAGGRLQDLGPAGFASLVEERMAIILKDLDWSKAVWFVDQTDSVLGAPLGRRYIMTHWPSECMGEVCPVHNPTSHHMSTWPKLWRGDTQVLERTCEHGVGHPDPDQFRYWSEIGRTDGSLHGCCLEQCCRSPKGDL